ncbi:type VI secretion protein [Acinetobacter baumannii]|nr:type VI secretion protein [Acinetobacter baumannii]
MEWVEVMRNTGMFFVIATDILRYGLIALGFVVFSRALVDFVMVSNPALAARFMTTVRRPSNMGAIAKLFIGVLMGTLGAQLQLVDVLGTLISDTTPPAVTWADYQQIGTGAAEEAKLTVLVIVGIMQFFGLLAVAKGLTIWRDNADGIAKQSVSQGFWFMVGGMLAYKIEVVHHLAATIFGLDFFKIIGIS